MDLEGRAGGGGGEFTIYVAFIDEEGGVFQLRQKCQQNISCAESAIFQPWEQCEPS